MKRYVIIQYLTEGLIHTLIPSLVFPEHTKSF